MSDEEDNDDSVEVGEDGHDYVVSGDRGHNTGEEELASKMLQIQSKRFYLDVKQNWRGRFIKVAEVGAGGRKSRLLMSMAAAAAFRDHLTTFGEYYANLGPPDASAMPEDGQLKSEVMVKENRRYYLDLKENSRGRFLRVTQAVARGPHGPRSQVALPAQGIVELRDALTQLLDAYGQDTASVGNQAQSQLPDGKQLRVDNKTFFFDVGQNQRGVYMRISEVKGNFRSAITIPERSWTKFRDIFGELCDQMAANTITTGSVIADDGICNNDEANAIVDGNSKSAVIV